MGNLGRAGEHNNTKIIFALSPELAKCDFLTAEVSTAAGEKIPIEGIYDEENSTFAIFLTNQLTVEGAISLQLVGYVTESETAEPQIITKSPVVSGFITQGINGVETEADSNPNLLARIWAKVREWADKIHTHDNKKTLDQLYCKALEDMFSQGDDEGYLTFRGDKLRPISDGVVIKEVEAIEKDGAKFLRLLLNKGGGLSNNWLPDFIDIPVNAVKEVEEENPSFDFTLNGSELELPTGGTGGGLTPEQAAQLHTHDNKDLLDTITKEMIAEEIPAVHFLPTDAKDGDVCLYAPMNTVTLSDSGKRIYFDWEEFSKPLVGKTQDINFTLQNDDGTYVYAELHRDSTDCYFVISNFYGERNSTGIDVTFANGELDTQSSTMTTRTEQGKEEVYFNSIDELPLYWQLLQFNTIEVYASIDGIEVDVNEIDEPFFYSEYRLMKYQGGEWVEVFGTSTKDYIDNAVAEINARIDEVEGGFDEIEAMIDESGVLDE